MKQIEQWDYIEIRLQGKKEGNPFLDYEIVGTFTGEKEQKKVAGFYDGNGEYVVRFMPCFTGIYEYQIEGSFSEKKEQGSFEVIKASSNNHGPVRVRDGIHLAYEDGTPYQSIGTTCYAWMMQDEGMQEQTLETLKQSAFNKIRFCFFPKYYEFNLKEPISYPYERGVQRGIQKEWLEKLKIGDFHSGEKVEIIQNFDCYRLNVDHFKRFDKRIKELCQLGIEADMILFHPYDKWGFSMMEPECEALYLKYIAARYGAFRNVWWSMANEYDLFPHKTIEDWDENGRVLRENDPYKHLCSIHNCLKYYDYHKDWITHCSMQRIELYRTAELTDQYIKEYHKPVVWDEISYEGNLEMGWGNITGEEMTRRFWEAFLRGGHAGHGETYKNPENKLWWSHGGSLHGTSWLRFKFLKEIIEETPGHYLKAAEGNFDEVVGIPWKEEKQGGWNQQYVSYEIHYYGFGQPSYRSFDFPEEAEYEIEVIDTWNMTIQKIGRFKGYTRIELPGRQYMAVRLRRVNGYNR